MPMKLDGPIPGSSLTREVGNAPWEQPPLYAKPEQAIANTIKQLTKGSRMDDLLFLVGEGFPISTFVDSLLTTSVMEGYHTGDVSQLIAPVIHTFIKEAAQSAGVPYTEWDGPTPEEQDSQRFKQRLNVKFASTLADKSPEPVNASNPFVPSAAANPTMGQPGMAPPQAPESSSPPEVESLGPNQGYIQKRSQV
jgi:hypothetical protein